jgi:hypothetical protein
LAIQVVPFLVLGVLWAAFFLWPMVQRRMSGTNRNSIGDFSRRVSALGGISGRGSKRSRGIAPIAAPRPVAFKAAGPRTTRVSSGPSTGLPVSATARKRRRDALALFAIGAFGSLVLAIVVGGTVLWAIQILLDLLLIGYVVALVMIAKQARARRAQVHYLPPRNPAQSSALVLRRTASS